MPLPLLSENDIMACIPDVEDVRPPIRGGQKLVFPCKLNGAQYALKVMLKQNVSANQQQYLEDEVTERARREVQLMRTFDNPHIVKMGGVDLTHATIRRQRVVYFTEEWIDGADLKTLITQNGHLDVTDLVSLGQEMAEAIELLWTKDIVHRDIKPGNIMRRRHLGTFVLLDMGLALDLADISLTQTGHIPMTQAYASPEQLNLARKRELDSRSDLFALGLVLYEAATGKHPFLLSGMPDACSAPLILDRRDRV